MSWSISVAPTARVDAEAAIDAAQATNVSEGAAAQIAVAKELAKTIVRALPEADVFVSGSMAGHYPDPGTWPYGGINVNMAGVASPVSEAVAAEATPEPPPA